AEVHRRGGAGGRGGGPPPPPPAPPPARSREFFRRVTSTTCAAPPPTRSLRPARTATRLAESRTPTRAHTPRRSRESTTRCAAPWHSRRASRSRRRVRKRSTSPCASASHYPMSRAEQNTRVAHHNRARGSLTFASHPCGIAARKPKRGAESRHAQMNAATRCRLLNGAPSPLLGGFLPPLGGKEPVKKRAARNRHLFPNTALTASANLRRLDSTPKSCGAR